jgi:hypothetical protein
MSVQTNVGWLCCVGSGFNVLQCSHGLSRNRDVSILVFRLLSILFGSLRQRFSILKYQNVVVRSEVLTAV